MTTGTGVIRGFSLGVYKFPAGVARYLLGEAGHDRASLEKYTERVASDCKPILPLAPPLARIWDIGCGIGAHAVYLAGVCGGAQPLLWLTEGDGQTPRKVGFVPGTEAWFDVKQSLAFARANLPTGASVKGVTADPHDDFLCDLVVSLKSWGHHYPVSTYLPAVKRRLDVGGRLVIDIRAGTGGDKKLEAAGFAPVAILVDKPKRKRIVYEHRAV